MQNRWQAHVAAAGVLQDDRGQFLREAALAAAARAHLRSAVKEACDEHAWH
jgi:hypothetical protein